MGWAIRRDDGTYRAWFRNAKPPEVSPAAGEAWEERDTEPEPAAPKGPLPDHRLVPVPTLHERAQTVALLDFLNLERAVHGLPDLTEDDFNARVKHYMNRL